METRTDPVMIIHGGADDVPVEMIHFKVAGVKKACCIGYGILKQCGGSALDAVEAAINSMEEDEVFNTGRGSVLNEDGDIEMDAAIMVGKDLSTGGVTIVKEIMHPISLARLVMEKTPHILIGGEGANRLAAAHGIPRVPTSELITDFARADLEVAKRVKAKIRKSCCKARCDTVGAVALDKNGHIAAGTSTGGLSGKMVGRSSDSSKVGSGLYADDRFGGVSVTGHGESIAKVCLSFTIIKELENGMCPQEAAEKCVNDILKRFDKQTGTVVLSKSGDIGVFCTSQWMPWAFTKRDKLYFGPKPGQQGEEDFS